MSTNRITVFNHLTLHQAPHIMFFCFSVTYFIVFKHETARTTLHMFPFELRRRRYAIRGHPSIPADSMERARGTRPCHSNAAYSRGGILHDHPKQQGTWKQNNHQEDVRENMFQLNFVQITYTREPMGAPRCEHLQPANMMTAAARGFLTATDAPVIDCDTKAGSSMRCCFSSKFQHQQR